MYKHQLFDLISSYEKKEVLSEQEKSRLGLLRQFAFSDEIQKLSGDDDVPFEKFQQYASEHVSSDYLLAHLATTAKSDDPFKKFIAASGESISELEKLPSEIRDFIYSDISESDLVRVSRTSSSLYYETKKPALWRDEMIAAGCDPALFDQLVRLGVVHDYQNLCHAYQQIIKTDATYRPLIPFRPNQLWCLLCLSGEPDAIARALTLPGVDMHLRDRNMSDRYFLDYLIHSGKTTAIDFIKKRGFNFRPAYKEGPTCKKWLEVAAETGSVAMMQRIEADTNPYDLHVCFRDNLRDYTILDSVFRSGNISAINYVLKRYVELNADAKTLNQFGRFFFSAIQSTSLPAVNLAWELREQGFEGPSSASLYKNALEHAAEVGSVEVFDRVLELCPALGIDPVKQPSFLLHFAVISQNSAMVDRVAAFCSANNIDQTLMCGKIDERRGNIVHIAFTLQSLPFIRHVLQLGQHLGIDLSLDEGGGQNILHKAVKSQNPDVVLFARQVCADLRLPFTPQTTDNYRRDAFHFANGNEKLIWALTVPLEELVLRPFHR